MTQFQVTLSPEAAALVQRLGNIPGMLAAVARTLDLQNQYTVSHIQKRYLSFSKSGPPTLEGLRFQTGNYSRTLRASKAVVSGATIVSAIGSNATNKGVSYPAVHEFGATIPPHTITAKGKALSFMVGGKVVLRKKVNHPGATIPARAPIKRGLADRLPDYEAAINRAVINFYVGGNQ